MRLTLIQFKTSKTWLWKVVWKIQGKFTEPPLHIPKVLSDKGIVPTDPGKKEKVFEKWKPPVDDPRFWEPQPVHELPNYHDVTARIMNRKVRLTYGTRQAFILAKAQSFQGLPPSAQQLVGSVSLPDQDKLVQRCIMLSQKWNPTRVRLPKRIDKEFVVWYGARDWGITRSRSMKILTTSLLQLCLSLSAEYPAILKHRRLLSNAYLDTHFYYDDKLINILGEANLMISSNIPLAPFADEGLVDESVNASIPSIAPALPTLDLLHSHLYTAQNVTPFVDHQFPHHHPHTLFLLYPTHWKKDEHLAAAVMYCLGYSMAHARKRFGEDVRRLPEPVCVQCVLVNEASFSFVCFQLNTLELDSPEGIKNQVWIDADNKLFDRMPPKPWRGPEFKVHHLSAYDSSVFPKFLALYLNGLPQDNHQSVLHASEIAH